MSPAKSPTPSKPSTPHLHEPIDPYAKAVLGSLIAGMAVCGILAAAGYFLEETKPDYRPKDQDGFLENSAFPTRYLPKQ